jgi:signal transduction histidine kinase
MENEKINRIRKIKSIYNKSYHAYLDKINPSVFLNIFLSDILNIFNTNCGVIMTNINDELNVITNSSNVIGSNNKIENELVNDWILFNNFINDNKKINSKSIISKCIKECKSIICKYTNFRKLFGMEMKNEIKKFKDYKMENLVIIPFIFNNKTNGILIINKFDVESGYLEEFEIISELMGGLFFNLEIDMKTNSKINNNIEQKSLNPNMTYQLLLNILNNINDEFVIVDNKLRLIYYNDQFIESFKTDNNNFLYDIIPKTISLVSKKDNLFQNKKFKLDEKTNLIIKSINSQNNIFHIVKVKRDICHNKCINNKNLVAYLSHELRNPIQAISTGIFIINKSLTNNKIVNTSKLERSKSNSSINSNILDSDIDKSDSELSDSTISISDHFDVGIDSNYGKRSIKSIIKRVDNACKNLNIIINDILDLSKIDNDELVLNVESTYLDDIIDVICDEYEEQCIKKNLHFICTKNSNVPDIIHTDPTRLYQIISNLITNSIKYSKAGTIQLLITYNNDNNNINFQISDQGKGIRDEELPNLFNTFGFTSNSYEKNSNGLGLSVCQKIAKLLGGNIEVTSQYKKGSTFTFIHPIKLLNSSSNPDLSDLIQSSKIKESSIKANIMIVDDDENITSLFKLLLKWFNIDFGYELTIDTVNSGNKSIELSKQKKYDIIFMDIDLDGQDGRTVTNEILNTSIINNTTPIIAVSANIKLNKNLPDCDCFSDIILKPFNDKKIKNILIKYLS